MAITFRSAGTRLKADVSASGGSQSLALPAGHANGDLLLMYLVFDGNSSGIFTPSGWTEVFFISNGLSTSVPLKISPHLVLFYRVDDGTLGASTPINCTTDPWPTGSPILLATVLAYTGCDPSAPIGEWAWHTDVANTAAQAHPQVTTKLANDWLVTARVTSSDSPAPTFTDSVGTDVERVDDSAFSELAFGIYDSATALATGLQPARTTTASRTVLYGSLMTTVALRPAATGTAIVAAAQTAIGTGTANDAAVQAVPLPWELCGDLPEYTFAIDWGGDGSFATTGDDVTSDVLSTGVAISYGRDQSRQLNQAKVGTSSFSLNNAERKYSPDWSGSVLFGDLEPSREMQGSVGFNGVVYPLGFARIDDYTVNADIDNRTVDFTFMDGMNLLNGYTLSTPVLTTQRTGDLINYILDQMAWTGPRDIDPGATVVKFWWAEGTTAFAAVQDLVKSEGPPSIAYVGLDGTFVFRDRHHRILRSGSTDVQATFVSAEIDCAAPAATGFHFTAPFTYEHGGKNITNSVSFDVTTRAVDPEITAVWSSTDTVSLGIGESRVISASGSDPFTNAITPLVGTDFTTTGVGVVQVQLSRTSGQEADITLMAIGGAVTITGLQLRAQAIPVISTTNVSQQDTGSISTHGELAYPDTVPWADIADAGAVASVILLHYAQRRPTVQLRVVAADAQHFAEILNRQISDRIHITNGETGTDADFFIETVSHQIDRMNQPGLPPVHAVVFGCEKDLDHGVIANPFRFDVRGAGFDQGVFDPISPDSRGTVFIFDDPVTGQFDFGEFGT
jgi:hypothetical protein